MELPRMYELIPGELSITLDAPDIPCIRATGWRLMTRGLRKHGQREIILILRRHENDLLEKLLKGPLDYFRTVHRYAASGQTVGAGGRTGFVDSASLGWPDKCGFIYVEPVPLVDGGALRQKDAIVALMLVGD